MARHRSGVAAGFLFLVACLLQSGAASAAPAAADWRREVAAVRALAENDAPRAYNEALRLQENPPADATPADTALVLNLLSRVEIYLAQTDAAAQHADQALELAKKSGDRVGQAEANLNSALVAINRGGIAVAGKAASDALSILDGVDRPDLLGEAMLRTGMTYRRGGQIEASVTMALQALELAQRSKDPFAIAYAHQGLGVAYQQSSRYPESQRHYTQMREQAVAANSLQLQAFALQGLGVAADNLGDRAGAEAMAKEAVAMFRKVGTPFNVNFALFSLSRILRKQDRLAECVALLDETVAIYRRYPNPIGLWWTLNTRSADLQVLGRVAAAAVDADQAYALAKEIDFPYYIGESARRLAAIAAARGEPRRAYELEAEAAAMAARTEREKAGEDMLKIAERYQSESRRREIEELTRREQRRILEERWLWTLLGASVVLLAITAYFLQRLRRSHRLLASANAQLRQSQDEIRALNLDLEQRVQARTDELRQQTRYLRTLIDTLPVSVWLKDTESRYLTVNAGNAAINGHTAEEMIGKTDEELWPGEVGFAFRASDMLVMHLRRRKTMEMAIPGADGAVHWREIDKAPVIDEDGTLLGTVGVARDISERKAAEAAREAALVEAQRLAQVRSDFLAQMSHELRTPLNGILGYAQVLLRNTSLDERDMAGLAVIQQSGEQLLTLIDDILDFARIEAGKLEVSPDAIPLQTFLRTIAGIVGVRAEQKGLLFVCAVAPDVPDAILADERMLRQVLLNLLANAVKFTDSGEVALRVTFSSPQRLRFAVHDTGIGIDADRIEAIFHPFEQAGELRRRLGGTGLGLAISRELVRRLGGELRVDSQIGAGSTFWFDLEAPAVALAIEPPSHADRVTGYAGPRKRILVMEDLAENRRLVIDMLEPLGFDLAEAADGRAGIECAQAFKPDLFLIDTVMPEMDGFETTRHLRRMPGFENVPIIAVSASATALDRSNCLLMGASDFMPKPIDLDGLLASIAALLHIEWTREPPAAKGSPELETGEPLAVPPAAEMQILHRLALQGNMRDIKRYAAELSALDVRYHPFASRLRQMAEGYQSKAILAFVERHLHDAVN